MQRAPMCLACFRSRIVEPGREGSLRGLSQKTENKVREAGAALINGESLEMWNILFALAATAVMAVVAIGRRMAIRR